PRHTVQQGEPHGGHPRHPDQRPGRVSRLGRLQGLALNNEPAGASKGATSRPCWRLWARELLLLVGPFLFQTEDDSILATVDTAGEVDAALITLLGAAHLGDQAAHQLRREAFLVAAARRQLVVLPVDLARRRVQTVDVALAGSHIERRRAVCPGTAGQRRRG